MTDPQAPARTRWKAAGLHLAISTVVVGIVLIVPMLVWYPPALLPLAGLERWLSFLFAAVLLAGPLMTAIVYRTGKRTLRSDLVVIALIQIAFLGYAFYMLSRIRPVFMVAAGDHLELVRAKDIDRQDLAAAGLRDHELSWTGPRMVGLRVKDPPTRGLGLGQMRQDNAYPLRPALYASYDESAASLLSYAVAPDVLLKGVPRARTELQQALAKLGRPAESVRVIPIVSRSAQVLMLVDAISGLPLQPLAVSPQAASIAPG